MKKRNEKPEIGNLKNRRVTYRKRYEKSEDLKNKIIKKDEKYLLPHQIYSPL